MELRRAQDWLEEQLARWKRPFRDCEEDVTRAKAELSSENSNCGRARAGLYLQEKILRLAKARLEHAEEKSRGLPPLDWSTSKNDRRNLYRTVTPAQVDARSRRMPNARGRPLAANCLTESYAGSRADYAPLSGIASPQTPPPAPSPERKRQRKKRR